MQSTGHGSRHLPHPEHSSGMMMTSIPWLKMAPNCGGQCRMQVSQLMHSDISMRRGGAFHFGLRSRSSMRDWRLLAPGTGSRYPAGRFPEVATYPFLSDEWIEAAQAIREEYRGKVRPMAHSVKMNQVITDVPFGTGTIESHMDTSTGELELDFGHLEGPDLTVTMDYATAKAIIVEGNPAAGMQAFMAGKIRVQGDMTKLMAMQQAAEPDPAAAEAAARIQAITE
jgi:putative sterol carrier protein